MSDFSYYLSNIIGDIRREFTTVDVLRHLDEGGTLAEDQRNRAETLNDYASNAMDGLISGLEELGSLMLCAAIDKDGFERIDAANASHLVSILGDLIRGVYLLESNTKSILQKSEANAIRGSAKNAIRALMNSERDADTKPAMATEEQVAEVFEIIEAAVVRGDVNEDMRRTILLMLQSCPKKLKAATA